MSLILTRERAASTGARFVYPRPITFDEWLETGDHDHPTELVDGTIVEQPMVQLEHEKLNLWLLHILALYVRRAGIGTVLGTHSPVQITDYGGRLPDLFFVRKKNEAFLTSKATLTAPDLVIELVSPNDRRSDIAGETCFDQNATETDYRAIGVREIVYIDQQKQTIRAFRRTAMGDEYAEETPTNAPLILRSLNGIALQWDWIFTEPRPDEIDTVLSLLQNV